MFSAEGQFSTRKRDQVTGAPTSDTDTASDWAQDRGDVIQRLGALSGLDGHFFKPTTFITDSILTVAVAPDNA